MAAKPAKIIKSKITTLNTPNTLNSLMPHFGRVECRTTAKMIHAMPIPRASQPSPKVLPEANSMYRPNARELPEEKPSKII